MMTATVELDKLYSTPPLAQGSSRPLLRNIANNTGNWTALMKIPQHINTLKSPLMITGWLRLFQRFALSSSEGSKWEMTTNY
jgi:hypothetical protein